MIKEEITNILVGYLKELTGAERNGDLCYSKLWGIQSDQLDNDICQKVCLGIDNCLKRSPDIKKVACSLEVCDDKFTKHHQYDFLFRHKDAYYSIRLDITWDCYDYYHIHWYIENL